LKVLHIEAGRHLYGGARQVGYLISGLKGRGVDNLLVCRPGHALTGLAPVATILPTKLRGDLDITLASRLERLIREHAPDVVHVHSRRGADGAGGRAARAAGCPAVLTRRVESTEPAWWLRRKCAPYAAVVAISTAVAAEVEAAGVPRGKIRRIASVVDTRLFAADPGARTRLLQQFGLPDDAQLAGCAAQLIPRKAQDFLLPLAARLVAAEPRFKLLFFGQGRTRRTLERRAARLGLGDSVRFAGFLPEWPLLLPGLDLLLHPARREGLGAVLLEAMSAQVPVVAAAAGGIVDVIDDGRDGCLVPPDDGDAWQAALLGLLGDPARRKALAAAGRRKVEKEFTIDLMTDRYLELYRDVCR
jgi:glycosyltransferase involved in cell wall biosynthesis